MIRTILRAALAAVVTAPEGTATASGAPLAVSQSVVDDLADVVGGSRWARIAVVLVVIMCGGAVLLLTRETVSSNAGPDGGSPS